jgi:hypothetical protein
MEKVIRIFRSFAEAEAADIAYYRSLTHQQRLELMFVLLARYEGDDYANPGRLERVYHLTQRGRD